MSQESALHQMFVAPVENFTVTTLEWLEAQKGYTNEALDHVLFARLGTQNGITAEKARAWVQAKVNGDKINAMILWAEMQAGMAIMHQLANMLYDAFLQYTPPSPETEKDTAQVIELVVTYPLGKMTYNVDTSDVVLDLLNSEKILNWELNVNGVMFISNETYRQVWDSYESLVEYIIDNFPETDDWRDEANQNYFNDLGV